MGESEWPTGHALGCKFRAGVGSSRKGLAALPRPERIRLGLLGELCASAGRLSNSRPVRFIFLVVFFDLTNPKNSNAFFQFPAIRNWIDFRETIRTNWQCLTRSSRSECPFHANSFNQEEWKT
ncbi:MAG: hypothetical protein OXQ89_22665 [Rhodospirillaceae bacterium]|nr:hypothetical protein [Rhodospirillaceae bacterium]MDE0000556.1 hypothetical protein [Rhodospirillaceae bacterium]